jgi:hypothetical protein
LRILSFSPQSADVERFFSGYNELKTKKRTRLALRKQKKMLFIKMELRSQQAKAGLTRRRVKRQFGNTHRRPGTPPAPVSADPEPEVMIIDPPSGVSTAPGPSADDTADADGGPPGRNQLGDEDLTRDLEEGRVSLVRADQDSDLDSDSGSDAGGDSGDPAEPEVDSHLQKLIDEAVEDSDDDEDIFSSNPTTRLATGKKVCIYSLFFSLTGNLTEFLGYSLLWQ